MDGTIIPVKYTAIISVITLVLLFTSMILAVIVQWRYKYQSLSSPLTMFNHIINNKEYFKTPEQRNKSFVQSLETTWASKRKINDKRATLLKASMTIFLISIFFLLVATIFAIIVYIVA